MNRIHADWLREFDDAMLCVFGIDHAVAGMDERGLTCYAELSPEDAALTYGQYFVVCRIDSFWPSLSLGRTT